MPRWGSFPLLTYGKNFGMLWTAQNRCGVFAVIGTMLTGGQQEPSPASRLYEEENELRFYVACPCIRLCAELPIPRKLQLDLSAQDA